jgi:hypothetical protein
MKAKCLGNGGTCDIRVEDSCFKTAAVEFNCGKASYKRLTNAAFTADNTDKLVNLAVLIYRCESRLLLLTSAVCGASGAIVSALHILFIFLFFCHFEKLLWD